MSSSSSGVSGVQELRELVLIREDELKFAQWKLDDAKKRLQEAEALEWAWELEATMKQNKEVAVVLLWNLLSIKPQKLQCLHLKPR